MDDYRQVIAKNLTELRRARGMTQAELAELLSYSDKAISKWERGESMPDIAVLATIGKLFGVTVDYLISSHREDTLSTELRRRLYLGRALIVAMSVLLVWAAATVCFVMLDFFLGGTFWFWLLFVYAVPTSLVVWLVFNTLWFAGRRNSVIVSLLVWSALAAVHLTIMYFGFEMGLIYIVGAPIQVIVILWFRFRHWK